MESPTKNIQQIYPQKVKTEENPSLPFDKAAEQFCSPKTIAVIAAEPALICAFVKEVCKQCERVHTLVNTMQIALLALFICQTAENSNISYCMLVFAMSFHDLVGRWCLGTCPSGN